MKKIDIIRILRKYELPRIHRYSFDKYNDSLIYQLPNWETKKVSN